MSFQAQRANSTSPGRRRSRARTFVILLVLILVVALLAGAAYARHYYTWCQGADGPQEPIDLTIPQGATGSDVVNLLHDQGVLRCDTVPRYIVGRDDVTFEAGDYSITTNMSLDAAIQALTVGPEPLKTITATVPEGLTVEQTAEEMGKQLRVSSREIQSLAESGRFAIPPYLPSGAQTAEGFLFPKTYEFVKGEVTPRVAVEAMLSQFEEEAASLPWDNAEELGLSPYEIVVLASLIEKEAANDAERAKIASVIYNRLNSGTPLYIDATLNYIDPDPSNGLTESDLKIKSPYNTRLVKGLPPTPIASPGRASLKSALEPASTDYEYYVLCGNSHRFTSSYNEFLAWKDQCL